MSECLTPRAYRAIHVTRRLCFLIAVAVAAGATAAAAATPVVPLFTQHRIAATVPSGHRIR
jgi:hypothetical protein